MMEDSKRIELYGLKHIAFIMDGNGRWAKSKGMPREYGHQVGAKTFRSIVKYCADIGIEYVTVYAFSTENWKRPKKEVNSIMNLLRSYLDECAKGMDQNNISFRFVGDISMLDDSLQQRIYNIEKMTRDNRMILNIAINYGGRDELVHAFNALRERGIDNITVNDINNALYTAECPDPDLIVRTAGEYRLSNFLLWQSAYSEFYFTDVLWPDFKPENVYNAILEFGRRKRNFGGV